MKILIITVMSLLAIAAIAIFILLIFGKLATPMPLYFRPNKNKIKPEPPKNTDMRSTPKNCWCGEKGFGH